MVLLPVSTPLLPALLQAAGRLKKNILSDNNIAIFAALSERRSRKKSTQVNTSSQSYIAKPAMKFHKLLLLASAVVAINANEARHAKSFHISSINHGLENSASSSSAAAVKTDSLLDTFSLSFVGSFDFAKSFEGAKKIFQGIASCKFFSFTSHCSHQFKGMLFFQSLT